jgi:hypothetical protein
MHLEVNWRNKLRINSASSWFSLHKCFNFGDINAWSSHKGIFQHLTILIPLVPLYSAYYQYSDKSTIKSDVLILETGNVKYSWNFTLITFDSINEVPCSWKERRVTVTSNIQPYKLYMSFVIDCLTFPRTVRLVPLFCFASAYSTEYTVVLLTGHRKEPYAIYTFSQLLTPEKLNKQIHGAVPFLNSSVP